jgi:hypothetical protein
MCQNIGPLSVNLAGGEAGHFAVSSNSCDGKTLRYQEDCSVTVSFKPLITGVKTAQVEFREGALLWGITQLTGTGTGN